MRRLLLAILAIVGTTALYCGIIIFSDPDGSTIGLNPELLAHSPFNDFFIPGLILAFIVGGSNLLAGVFVMGRVKSCYTMASLAGVMIVGWIIVQMVLIRQIDLLQFVYLLLGSAIILLAIKLK